MGWYLRHIEAERYGAFADRRIGPFAPGLNVVYGPNEAGKSTAASLVGSVLFGWEEARGVLNTYRPAEGERSGELEFASEQDAGGSSASDAPAAKTLSRSGASGLRGDADLVADIDRSTFRTMFSLNSDELRSLRNSSDVTARLLTAGSGTGSSPSAAYVEIEQRIAALTSNASDASESVIRLVQDLEAKRAEVDVAAEQAKVLKRQHRELRELRESRAEAAERIEQLNREVEDLVSCRSELESIDERMTQRRDEQTSLRKELAEHTASSVGESDVLDERLLALDSSAERVLRDKIDNFAETYDKAKRIADTDKENATASTAAYEALVELSEGDGQRRRPASSRALLAGVCVVPTVVFALAGTYLFMHGRSIASLSFTALGIGLIVMAFFLAAAAIVMLLRPRRAENSAEDRIQDARWVMLQDCKKRDGSQAEVQRVEAEIAAFLDESGLAVANGSLRQARSILDDAREERSRRIATDQRIASIDMRIQALEEEIDALRAARQRAVDTVGLEWEPPATSPVARIGGQDELDGCPVRVVEDLVRQKSAQRDALLEVSDGMSMRFGELSRTLEQAASDRTYDALKQEVQLISTRLREGKRQLVELLLAKRMLERSIAAWESSNQPEVYAEASRLLSMITGGTWVEIGLSPSGSLVARTADGVSRKPRHLSLGTCQQLYLALRVALLLTAQDVGRAVPVLADDILVNFDAERRRGAARVLAELAASRQVIVFTCHEETVAALREAAPSLNSLTL